MSFYSLQSVPYEQQLYCTGCMLPRDLFFLCISAEYNQTCTERMENNAFQSTERLSLYLGYVCPKAKYKLKTRSLVIQVMQVSEPSKLKVKVVSGQSWLIERDNSIRCPSKKIPSQQYIWQLNPSTESQAVLKQTCAVSQ